MDQEDAQLIVRSRKNEEWLLVAQARPKALILHFVSLTETMDGALRRRSWKSFLFGDPRLQLSTPGLDP